MYQFTSSRFLEDATPNYAKNMQSISTCLILHPLSVLRAQRLSPSLDMLCNLAYVNNVRTTDFSFYGRTRLLVMKERFIGCQTKARSIRKSFMILCEINWLFTSFECWLSGSCPILPVVTIESGWTTLKPFDSSREQGNLQSPQSPSFIWGQKLSLIYHSFR